MSNIPDWKSVDHKAPVRNERRVMVEVDCEPCNGQYEFCQQIKAGKSVALLYESELPTLERLTQDDAERADWAAAERTYQAQFDAAVNRIPAKDAAARQHAADSFGASPSSFFESMRPGAGGKRPFRSFRVLARDIPPPETPGNLQANQMSELAKTLAQLLGLQSQSQAAKAR